MIDHIDYWPAAQVVIDDLEADPVRAAILDAVNRTIDRLVADLMDRRLGTKLFMTEELGGLSATPVRLDDWFIFWQRGPEPGGLDIVAIAQLDV
jgi:hypothetical protein